MSLLLDALNKADQERKRGGENPNISSNHDAQANSASAKPGLTLKLLLGGVVLALLLASVYWLGKKNQQPAAITTAKSTSAQVVTPPQDVPQTTGSTIVIGDTNEATPRVPVDNSGEASEDENIASLYQHQARDTLPIPSTGAIQTGPNAETIVDTPATHAVAAGTEAAPVVDPTPASNTAPASPISLSQFANLPDIQDLPNSVLQRIPSLKYSEHNYNTNGGSVMINGIIRHTNDQLINGLVIDKILEDGLILHFENYSFKMRALNTWVNM